MARSSGGPGGGSDPGNSGGSSGSSSGGGTGGGRSGGGFGRDTPGSPNAADGKRGSTMGQDGGVAPGRNTGGAGRDTPGAPQNEGRRGTVAGAGVSTRESARRARNSMQSAETRSLVGEQTKDYGIGEAYNFSKELQEKKKGTAMTPRERDIQLGIEDGQRAQIAAQAMKATTVPTRMASAILGPETTSVVGGLINDAVEKAFSQVPQTQGTKYGAALARRETKNSTLQDAAQAVTGAVPGLGMAVSFGNVAYNDKKSREALGLDTPAPSTNKAPAGSGNGSTQVATTAPQRARQAFAPARSFESPTLDMGAYSSGLMSLSQNL